MKQRINQITAVALNNSQSHVTVRRISAMRINVGALAQVGLPRGGRAEFGFELQLSLQHAAV